MDTLMQLVTKGNDFLWSFLLLVLLCGTGLYYTIRLRFIQVRKFGEGVRQVFGHFSMNGEKHEKGEMTPFQSIATAIAAQVGTGNLAGAATALIGGCFLRRHDPYNNAAEIPSISVCMIDSPHS